MVGKPCNGQRTWSNSWNSYKTNKILRNFISDTQRKLSKSNKIEKINYKIIKKKYLTKNKNKTKELSKKKNIWF
jgi:hypothetical protein